MCTKFVRPIIKKLYCKQIIHTMDSKTASSLKIRVTSIERQISALSSEVKDIKRILAISDTTSQKRKISEESIPDIIDLNVSKKVKGDLNVDADGFVQVYTDGACENNGKKGAKAGLGVWFGPNHPLNVAEPVKRRPTNNVGEIEACTRAIQQAASAGIQKLCINTDSEFTINCMTKWIYGWKKKGWKTASGKPVLNKDELSELDENLSKLEKIKWNHVRGHRGIEGNEAADELARQGATKYNKK